MDGSGSQGAAPAETFHETQEESAPSDSDATVPSGFTPPSPAPVMPPASHGGGIPSSTVGMKEQIRSLSPQNIAENIGSQLLGEKTQQQLQAEQERQSKLQQLAAAEQESYQRFLASQKATQQRRVQEVTQAKIEARKTQSTFSGSSAVMQQLNSAGDLSELSVIEKSTRDALTREERFRQKLAAPQSTPKGPQGEGEGSMGKKGSMVDRMQTGAEKSPFKSQQADALQRAAEKALNE